MPTLLTRSAATTPLAAGDLLYVVQDPGGTPTEGKAAVSDLTAGRAISALSLTVTGSGIPTNGLYLPAANTVGVATNGVLRASYSTTALTLASGMALTLTAGAFTVTNGKTTLTDTSAEVALQIFSSATTTPAFAIECDTLTTGFVGSFYTNSGNTGVGAVVRVVNDNAAATGRVGVYIQQDSTALAIAAAGSLTLGNNGTVTNLTLSGAAGSELTAATKNFTAGGTVIAGTLLANTITLTGAAAANDPAVSVAGSDADIDLALIPKGAGLVSFGAFTADALAVVAGTLNIKDIGGTTRKVMIAA